jgi:hypothetical protein
MNINKSILAAALGLSVACASQAANVYMSGSTAMRATIYNALTTAGVVFTAAPTFTGYGGKGNGDTYMAFSGTLKNGSGTTVIKCYWSGSEAGVQDVALGQFETFIADGALNGVDNAGTPTGANAETAVVNLCMADNAQTYSRTKSPSLTGTKVGIITFKWLRNAGLWTGSNVTDSQIRQALGGSCPIGVFTGSNDVTSFVYVSGRDTSSGTRVNALGDSGYGILTTVGQIELVNGVMQDINGDGTYQGNFGFSSGGSLAASLNASTTAQTDLTANSTANGGRGTGTGFSVIAYLGYNDAKTALAGTPAAVELTYDGVAFSTNNIINGTYTFWGNEYVYKANNVSSTQNQNAYLAYQNISSIVSGIDTAFDGVAAIPLDLMHCSRPGPTGDPTHN